MTKSIKYNRKADLYTKKNLILCKVRRKYLKNREGTKKGLIDSKTDYKLILKLNKVK